MTDSSVVSFKIYLFNNDSDEPEIRRFGLLTTFTGSYSFLIKKLTEVFPKLSDKTFTVAWKDEEGDDVAVSSDEELIIALTSMKTDVKKLYLRVQSPTSGSGEKDGAVLHPGVYCDGCERNIVGYRYKCLVCSDYDLCGGCEQDGIHPEHVMLRISYPCAFDRVNIHKLAHLIKSFVPEVRHHNGDHLYACKKRRKHEKRRSCPMSEVSPDAAQFRYLEWGLGALQKLLNPLGATVEIQVPRKPEETDKEEKKEEKQDKQTPDPGTSPSQQEVRFPNAQEISETMKQKIDEITKILASQAVSNGAEEDGWVAFEELKKGTEETRPSTSRNVPKDAQAQPSAPAAEDKEPEMSQTNLYPNLSQDVPSDPRIREALQKMLSMGFTNEGGWLTRLLVAKGGSIEQALEVLAPVKK